MKCIDRNDDSKNRCPLGGRFKFLITILKTFSMWVFGSLFLCAHKIGKSKNILRAIFVLTILTVLCGAERSPATQEKGKVISKTIDVVTIDSTAGQDVQVPEEEEAKTLKSNEEIADEVILGIWGNGEERDAKLNEAGYDPAIIQELVNSKMPKETKAVVVNSTPKNNGGGILTKRGGVCYNNPYGYKETWYSQRVLPGGGLKIPGRHVDSRGIICDEEGYICVAVNVNDARFPYGSILQTSLGLAKVYDHGCAMGVIDVYVDW